MMNAPNSAQTAGSFSATQRPKNRFIDRVLMYNRDQKMQEATMQLAAEQGAVGGGAPNPMSGGSSGMLLPQPGGQPRGGGMAQGLLKMLGRG
jgi:hypothetical protein